MSNNTEQEMLDCFLKLNEAEKEAVLQLLQTFIKSKEQSEILNLEQYNSDAKREELKIEVVRYAAKNNGEKIPESSW